MRRVSGMRRVRVNELLISFGEVVTLLLERVHVGLQSVDVLKEGVDDETESVVEDRGRLGRERDERFGAVGQRMQSGFE